MHPSNHDLVNDYITAVSDGDFGRLADLVHPEATFAGTVVNEAHGAGAFVQGFRNLRPITVRCGVRDVIVEGTHASVLYDFVTDTHVGSVLCAEFLTIEDDLIRSSTLLLDWRQWPDVIDELRSRMAKNTQPA